MATQIQYLKGDATDPKVHGTAIVAHICNDKGGWGKGFVLAVSKRPVCSGAPLPAMVCGTRK